MERCHHGNDVKVTDEDGFLSRSMMIKAKNMIMKERIWINRVDLFQEIKTAQANVQEVRLEPRLRPIVASATREEHSHGDS